MQPVTREEALASGLSEDAILRNVQRGIWQRPFPGVYFPFSGRPTFQQRVLAACRWCGGIASHRTGGTLYKLLESSLVEVTTTRCLRAPRPEIVVHRVDSLLPRDTTWVGAIPATTPIRTIIDLAAVVEPSVLRKVAFEAVRRDLIHFRRLEEALKDTPRGRRGVSELRKVMREGLDTYLERKLRSVLANSPLPRPTAQYEVRTPRGRSFFIDSAYPEQRIAIETDGWAFHSDPDAFQRDRARWRELAKMGWTVLCFTYEDITVRPNEVIETIATALKNAA